MQINNNYQNTNFKAKFYDSPALREIANYAIEHGKTEALNNARKNIDHACLRTKLYVDVFEKNGRPVLAFSKYLPNDKSVINPGKYEYIKTVEYPSSKQENMYAYALKKIISMGNDVPNNNIFKKVVIGK